MSKSREVKQSRDRNAAVKRGTKENIAELTEAEWEIMKVVWDKQPCAAGTVQEALTKSKNWAYSTIKTTMDRMVEKGFLQIEKMRNLQLFRSCISEIDAKRGEFRKMLKRAFNGALTPMMQFLIEYEGLSKNEASKLRELVKKASKKSEGKK
jgi:BlaI family penicillinase repressor